jgi:hypothetical protein
LRFSAGKAKMALEDDVVDFSMPSVLVNKATQPSTVAATLAFPP